MEDYITMVQQRLNWLTSGSRAPFGVISEKRLGTCLISHYKDAFVNV